MHTAIYVRVSTDDQKTDSQEHEPRAYCERRGWEDTIVYSDTISGSKFVRTDLDALMRAVRDGVLSVAKLRLGDLEKTERQLAEHYTARRDGRMSFVAKLAV